MNWRQIQLGHNLCEQDQIILDLIQDRTVRIHGKTMGFEQFCNIDSNSKFCLFFVNQPVWLSEIEQQLISILAMPTNKLYIGINRYQIKGNDINFKAIRQSSNHSQDLLAWLTLCLDNMNFSVKKQGFFEKDRGRHFNFVQPLTWIYAVS